MSVVYPGNAPTFSLQGIHLARVVSLHDGDTFTCVIKFAESFYKFSVRLAGIDTCEMTSKNDLLRTKAFMARDRLFGLLTKRSDTDTISWRKKDFDEYFQKNYVLVTLECHEMDKYGRVLADVDDGSITQILLNEKLACPYDGGKKTTDEYFLSHM